MKKLLISLLFSISCLAQVQNNIIIVEPATSLLSGGQLQFPDLATGSNYVAFTNPATVAPIPVQSVTTTNPIVITLLWVPLNLTAGTSFTISGASGCSALNGSQTVASATPTTVTVTGVNGSSCGSYVGGSAMAQFPCLLFQLPGSDCVGSINSDGNGHWTCGSSGTSYTFGTGLEQNGTSISIAQTDPTNVLGNPGFEDTPALTNWSKVAGGSNISLNTVDFFSGTQSVKFSGSATLGQRFQAQVGSQYSATVEYIGSAGADGTAELQVAYENAAGAIISGESFTVSGTPSTSWQLLTLSTATDPVPAGATYVIYYLVTTGQTTGYIAFDQATLRYIQQNDTQGLGSITPSNIGNGHELMEVVLGLPTCPSANYPIGVLAFNTVDGYIYKCETTVSSLTGTQWHNVQDPGDLVANTIAAGVIYAGTLNAGQIVAGTMSANYIYGGTIDANTVTLTNLNASNINHGVITLTGSLTMSGTLNVGSGLNVTGAITGATVTLNKNGITTVLDNVSFPGGIAGITVTENGYNDKAGLTPEYLEFIGNGGSSIAGIGAFGFTGSEYGYINLGVPSNPNVAILAASSSYGSLYLGGTGANIQIAGSSTASVGLNVYGEALFINNSIGIGTTGIDIPAGTYYQINNTNGYTNSSFTCSGTTHIHSANIQGGIIIGAPGCT